MELIICTGKLSLNSLSSKNCYFSITCYNNFHFITPYSGSYYYVFRKWLEIGTAIFKDVTSNDIELLEAATAAMRAILQQLAEVRANVFKQLTVDDCQPMLNGVRQCSNANVRVNLIRMLCNLVQILMNNKNSEDYEMIKVITFALFNPIRIFLQQPFIIDSLFPRSY